jgi:hypothetical protein
VIVESLRRTTAAAVCFVLLPALARGQASPVESVGYYLQFFAPDVQRTFTADQLALLEKLNRRDRDHLSRLTQIIAPDVWVDDELFYSPLPREWPWAARHAKALVVDQPSQLFGAYEYGRLVRWGPVSSGRAESPTPPGVFNLTWRAKSRRSTDNDAWLLTWYFNFINSRGVSFHEFELPGRAASHACVRLLARDAQWLYGWGQEWQLSANKRDVTAPGTPVVILGTFDFARPSPWLSLDWWRQPVALPLVPNP